jgi:hypothetical protein
MGAAAFVVAAYPGYSLDIKNGFVEPLGAVYVSTSYLEPADSV